MQVSRSGYSHWRAQAQTRRAREEETLLRMIRCCHQQSRGTYGSPRIWQECRAEGVRCSENRIARIMRKYRITARPLRRAVKTTDSAHGLPVAGNVVNRAFAVQQKNTVWSGDITYVWTDEGWMYLSVVIDLFSRRVVGWSMRSTLERSLVIEALQQAIADRRQGPGLVCHSDRGSQYASHEYQELIRNTGVVCSMSRKGDCYDNAPVESFFASLKLELVYRSRFETRAAARAAIFEWIAVWYNRKRRHSTLGYKSPEQFEWENQQPTATRQAA